MAESDGQPRIDSEPSAADKVKDALVSLRERPHAVLEIALVAILVLSFLAIAFNWIERELVEHGLSGGAARDQFGDVLKSAQLKIPLVLFGASIMGLMLLRTSSGAAVIIAVLVIGTIVAQENFLLALGHMFSGSKSEFRTYTYHAEAPTPTSPASRPTANTYNRPERVANPGAATYRSKAVASIHEKIEQAVTEVVESANDVEDPEKMIYEIVARTDKILEKEAGSLIGYQGQITSVPRYETLLKVVKDYASFEKIGQEADLVPRFADQMAKLKEEGYISCRDDDWTQCEPTDVGREFVNNLGVGQ